MQLKSKSITITTAEMLEILPNYPQRSTVFVLLTTTVHYCKFFRIHWLIDRVVVLHPTRHKIGHFGDVSPSQSLGLAWRTLNLTQQKHAFTNKKKCAATHPFNGPFPWLPGWAGTRKVKTNLNFTEGRVAVALAWPCAVKNWIKGSVRPRACTGLRTH